MGAYYFGFLFLKFFFVVFVHIGLTLSYIYDEEYMYNNYFYGSGGGSEQNCYSCTYHVRKGHTSGLENCADPFNEQGIPLVPCRGSCAEIYYELSSTEFTKTRTCLPYCKNGG